jgi:DNA-binding response OmpR family regulator
MPRMDGREWLRWFRAKRADSPVIIISGYHLEQADADLAPSVVLQKPVDVAELLDMVGLFCGLGTPIGATNDLTA